MGKLPNNSPQIRPICTKMNELIDTSSFFVTIPLDMINTAQLAPLRLRRRQTLGLVF